MPGLDKGELRGFLYAGIAAIALGNSFIFSKLSLNEISFYQFGFWWFLLGSIWNITYNVHNRKNRLNFYSWYSNLTTPLILVAIFEAIATGLFYYAILIMENPGVVSFIGNIGPVFVTLFGLILLKESFSKVQFLGIIIAISGIFILNFKSYQTVSEILIPGSQYVILASFLFSIAAIIARKRHYQIDAGILSLVRAILLLISFTILILTFGQFGFPGFKTLLYLAAGSFLEVFITIVFAYLSFSYIKAYKTSITISTKGIFALISSWLFLNLQPGYFEIAGGFLSLIGVFLVSRKR
jgi:drug/metabolite transporter (DMT)-like permease